MQGVRQRVEWTPLRALVPIPMPASTMAPFDQFVRARRIHHHIRVGGRTLVSSFVVLVPYLLRMHSSDPEFHQELNMCAFVKEKLVKQFEMIEVTACTLRVGVQ